MSLIHRHTLGPSTLKIPLLISYLICWLSFIHRNYFKRVVPYSLSPNTMPFSFFDSCIKHQCPLFQWNWSHQSCTMNLCAAKPNSYFFILGFLPFLIISEIIDQSFFLEAFSWILWQSAIPVLSYSYCYFQSLLLTVLLCSHCRSCWLQDFM